MDSPLPPELEVMMLAAEDDRHVPAQGSPATRSVFAALRAGATPDAGLIQEALDWVENQKNLWPKQKEVATALSKHLNLDEAPIRFPEWWASNWHYTLNLPWAEDLEWAIQEATEWLMAHPKENT